MDIKCPHQWTSIHSNLNPLILLLLLLIIVIAKLELTRRALGERRTSTKDNGRLFYGMHICDSDHFIRLDIFPVTSSYFSVGCVFITVERYCHLLDFKMFGIVEHRFPPVPNGVSCNVSEIEAKSVDLPCDSDLLQNVMGFFLGPQYTLPPGFMEIDSILPAGRQTNRTDDITSLTEVTSKWCNISYKVHV